MTRAGAIPVVLGGDHSIAYPDAKGVANVLGHGRVSMIHFDAHADTGDIEFGSLWGHGQPMRRLIESGALRGDRFLQVGLRGYWPGPETLDWMAAERMRSYEMTEIVHRGLTECLTEAFGIATDECEGVFLSVDIDVCDPGHAPGTGTPEPGGLTARELLDSVRRICLELPVVGIDVVEVSPPYDHADITAALANRVVLEALSAIARKRRDERDGTTWDPAPPAARPLGRPGTSGPDDAGPSGLTSTSPDGGCWRYTVESGRSRCSPTSTPSTTGRPRSIALVSSSPWQASSWRECGSAAPARPAATRDARRRHQPHRATRPSTAKAPSPVQSADPSRGSTAKQLAAG